MDIKTTITTQQEGNGFYIAQFKTADLAIYTYYVESHGQAVIIDPTYNTQEFSGILAKRNATLKYTILTHYHSDFISGTNQFDVPIKMGPQAKRQINTFEIQQYEDGSYLPLGKITLKIIHTPGHTSESSCFLLQDSLSAPICLFTGDTLFLGDIGRPDLAVNPGAKVEIQAEILFDSLQKIKALDGHIRIYPAHGSGSSVGKTFTAGNFCTIQTQKQKNNLFKETDMMNFIKSVCSDISTPKYFQNVAKLNQFGVIPYKQMKQKANNPLSTEEFKDLAQKMPIIDTRTDPQSLIQHKNLYWLTAKNTMHAWLVNILPSHESEYILFTELGKWQQTAQRFFRIGYFNIKGYNGFPISDWKDETWKPNIIKFDKLKEQKDVQIIDVRNKPEWKATGVVQNAILISLPELPKRINELKQQKNYIIHCRSGMRARVAASILKQNGIKSTILWEMVDKLGENGLKIVPYQE